MLDRRDARVNRIQGSRSSPGCSQLSPGAGLRLGNHQWQASPEGCGRSVESCGKERRDRNEELTIPEGLLSLVGCMDATLRDREAKRSLTTDTMCQNLFDPI